MTAHVYDLPRYKHTRAAAALRAWLYALASYQNETLGTARN